MSLPGQHGLSYHREWLPEPRETWRRVKVNHEAFTRLARELGLQGPIKVSRRRLRTCRGIHNFWWNPFTRRYRHGITLDSYPADPALTAMALGHELGHALDAERVIEQHDGDPAAWTRYSDANAAAVTRYEDQRHERIADQLGELLTFRILRDCLTIVD